MAYRHYKSGLCAVRGGLADQPPKYLEIMNIVDSEVSAIEQEKINGRSRN